MAIKTSSLDFRGRMDRFLSCPESRIIEISSRLSEWSWTENGEKYVIRNQFDRMDRYAGMRCHRSAICADRR